MKNYTIELFRFVFAVLIIGYHYYSYVLSIMPDNTLYHFSHGYMGDEFFFIVSGFFIANSITKGTEKKKSYQILLSRINSIKYPYYITWVLAFIGLNYYADDISTVLDRLFHSIPELLFVDMAGFEEGYYVNSLAWYISALFLVILITVPLVYKFGYTFCHYCAPLLSLFLYGVLCLNYSLLNAPHQVMFGFVYKGLIRCLAGVFAGYFIFSLSKTPTIMSFFTERFKLVNAIQIICLLLIILYCILPVKDSFDWCSVLLMVVLLVTTLCPTEKSFIENLLHKIPFVLKLGRFSVYMFLSQEVFYAFFSRAIGFNAGTFVYLPKYLTFLDWFYDTNVPNAYRVFAFISVCLMCSFIVLGIEKALKLLFCENAIVNK